VAHRCPNPDCPAKKRRAIYHFASRNALDIEGVGPETIDAFMDAGLMNDAADLFTLVVEDIQSLEGFGEVSARNLIDAINERTEIPLARFVYGLGIAHVGEETARALAEHFHSLDAITAASEKQLAEVPDVGSVVAASIVEWFAKPYNKNLLKKFAKAGVKVQRAKGAAKGKLSGKSFVVTGTLDAMSREDAEAKIRALGGKATGSISKETDYIVVGADSGSRNTARKYWTRPHS
jgi:DNA ligase (NAD+)